MSRPAWDAWIEIPFSNKNTELSPGSRPAWDAWIEILAFVFLLIPSKSRPAWDAWIEILSWQEHEIRALSRPAWDAWIEILQKQWARYSLYSRVPHGTRGLKCNSCRLFFPS